MGQEAGDMPREMSSRERVLTAFARQEPDRVPINYLSNPGIDARMKAHYGLAANDNLRLREILGVDFRGSGAPYVGPELHNDIPDRTVDLWGIRRRYVEHDSGGYWDYCDFPLSDATLDEIEAWPMPSPDDYDYSNVAAQCAAQEEFCVVGGSVGLPDIINSTGMIRTMEQVLVDLLTEDAAGLRYIERKSATLLEITARTLEAAKGGIHLFQMGEDLGTQIGPLVSLDLFRKVIRPIHQQFVDLAKAYDLPVIIHCCGSSSWAFDDFIEMGIDVVDTLQPEAANMAPAYLKGRYGDKLSFHGCISTAGPVATGSVQDTVDDVRETLDIMMPGGGYAMSPTHQLQDNSLTENVVAMYDTAREHGRY
jgi:uroporphyrinogen decarboxylase